MEKTRQEVPQPGPSQPEGRAGNLPGPGGGPASNTRSKRCNCCCKPHCNLSFHTLSHAAFTTFNNIPLPCDLKPVMEDLLYDESVCIECGDDDEKMDQDSDTFTNILMSLNLQM